MSVPRLVRGPGAGLTPVAVRTGRREPGLLKGKYDLPDEFFFDPLPEEELRLWEGKEDEGPWLSDLAGTNATPKLTQMFARRIFCVGREDVQPVLP